MEKNVTVSILCQIYGNLLTTKQLEIITDYYDNDLSLSEIAENNQITRQAVRDIIKKAEKKLFEFEEKLSFMEKQLSKEKIISNVIENLAKLELQELKIENIKLLKNANEELKKLLIN